MDNVFSILIALAVVGGVGLIAGILLAIFSHCFKVEEDEKAKKIREELPSINCGACGFKGCDDYAAAMASGKVRTNLCVPGGDGTAARIAEILGIEAEDTKEMIAFVHCNGTCDATSKKAIYDGVKTCRAASGVGGGPNSCLYGCMGFGDCAAVCPANAVDAVKEIAHIEVCHCKDGALADMIDEIEKSIV